MKDLTVELVLAIHDRAMARETGDTRLLSEAGIHQMVFRANLIPELFPRAAFILYSLIAYPVFREGNNRTAFDVTRQVLTSEGYQLQPENSSIKALMGGILSFTVEPEDIEEWLFQNVKKAGDPAQN